MNTTCRKTESGEVIFEWHLPIGARLGLGAMLFFFAIFFGYHLFSVLIEYIAPASHQVAGMMFFSTGLRSTP